MKITFPCHMCGHSVTRRKSQVKGQAAFCSYSCRARFYGASPSAAEAGRKAFAAKCSATATDRFWAKVDRREPEKCWEWTAYRKARGYGVLTWHGRRLLAHRVALSLMDDDWSNPLHVCHSCDNPACCNPAHLWRGSDQDNYNDMVHKGRSRRAKGEANGFARITAEIASAIRNSTKSQRELAEHYGVSKSLICHVKSGRTWGHIT